MNADHASCEAVTLRTRVRTAGEDHPSPMGGCAWVHYPRRPRRVQKRWGFIRLRPAAWLLYHPIGYDAPVVIAHPMGRVAVERHASRKRIDFMERGLTCWDRLAAAAWAWLAGSLGACRACLVAAS
jgi:hypothetical protein